MDEKGGNMQQQQQQQEHLSLLDSTIKLYATRLADTREIYLKNKAKVAASESKLADMLMARGREGGGEGGEGKAADFDRAVKLYESSLLLRKEIYLSGDIKHHPEVANMENKLASAYEARGAPGDVDIALKLYESSFTAKKMMYLSSSDNNNNNNNNKDGEEKEKEGNDHGGDRATLLTCTTKDDDDGADAESAITATASATAAATALSAKEKILLSSSSSQEESSLAISTLKTAPRLSSEWQAQRHHHHHQQQLNKRELDALRYMIRRILNLQEEVAYYHQNDSNYSFTPFSPPFPCSADHAPEEDEGEEKKGERHQQPTEKGRGAFQGGGNGVENDEKEEESDVVGTFRYPFKTCTFEDTKSFHRHRTWIAHTIGIMDIYAKADKCFEELRLEDRDRLKKTSAVVDKYLSGVAMLKPDIMNAIFPGYSPKSIM
mmetsp:Transcript_25020/g.34909  ORF Transcript_25020/g.34909 Transcript_25020/m.34909 type:complete len:435 (-) Transcript_25020:489-1793(-)